MIGEELIKVKDDLDHGEFEPWVKANCCLSLRRAQEYMKVARLKNADTRAFAACETIQDALATAKPKPTPKQELRAATLDDLRKVERLRALRDDPTASVGEMANAQAKLDKIEKIVGKEALEQQAKRQPMKASWAKTQCDQLDWRMEKWLIERVASTLVHKAEPSPMKSNEAFKELQKVLKKAYGDDHGELWRLNDKLADM